MNIQLARKDDAPAIAEIHCREITQGFLSTLGRPFLAKLYEAMVILPSAFVIIAKEKNVIMGFVSGATDVKLFYTQFFRTYALSSLRALLPHIFNLSTLKKIGETLAYPRKKEKAALPQAELLVIAVRKEFHGQGVAQELLKGFVARMKKEGIRHFKVIVGKQLLPAIKFYEKNGFIFHSTINIHEDAASKVYLLKI